MAWYFPLLVFLARIGDVSIGTVRIIMVMKGHKIVAMALGFCEVLIWLFAVSTVMTYVTQFWWIAFFYAGGYATGTMAGMVIEEFLAIGSQLVRVVNTGTGRSISQHLRGLGHVVTQVETKGFGEEGELCFVVVPRSETDHLVSKIREHSPQAFITVEDVRSASSTSVANKEFRSRRFSWRRLLKFK